MGDHEANVIYYIIYNEKAMKLAYSSDQSYTYFFVLISALVHLPNVS